LLHRKKCFHNFTNQKYIIFMMSYLRKHPFLALIIVPAFILYMVIILRSGSYYCFHKECGIFFWGVHGHDAIWHLAIANTSFNSFPFIAPTYSGRLLTGYNFLFDWFVFFLSKVGIPALVTYFKIFPLVWFIVFTSLLISLARKIKNSPSFIAFVLFFAYFSNSFSYILNLYHNGTLWGSSGILATLSVHTMSNPPFAMSLLILLLILIIVKKNHLDTKTVVWLGILNFINIGLKFYGGVLGIFLTSIFIFSKSLKKPKELIVYSAILSLSVLFSVFLFYDPFSSMKSGSIFAFSPFALIHTITEEPSLFYMRQITDARYYLLTKGIGPRLISIELFNLTIFLFFYLGVSFFGLLYGIVGTVTGAIDKFNRYILAVIILSIVLTATLVQKAEWWNVIQFFYYAIFLSSLLTAQLAQKIFEKKSWVRIILISLMVILSVPNSVDVMKHYGSFPGSAYLPKDEIEALAFLKKQPAGVVVAPLYDLSIKQFPGPNPLYAYEDTSYVSAFSGHPTYLANILQLRLTGIDYKSRLEKLKRQDCSMLDEVDYIYETVKHPSMVKLLSCKNRKIRRLFKNSSAAIYEVN